MKTIIAEKPSVAKEIARIVCAKEQKSGYYIGKEYYVTWALGHLVAPVLPTGYGIKGFHRNNLPIVPPSFLLEPRKVVTKRGYRADSKVLSQIRVIKKLFNDSERIIVATDAGREGELIFRYLYKYLDCKRPFDRLWVSSLTDKAIRNGLKQIANGEKYDNLYEAAKARSEADWLVGINATQAISIAAGQGTYSLGRVQTPTLAMVCSRYWENKRFEPAPIYQVHVSVDGTNGSVVKLSSEKFEDEQRAKEVYSIVSDSPKVVITEVERREVVERPPMLYDLTSLQKDANVKCGLTAEETLAAAQKLYENRLITYPRTGCNYITEELFEEAKVLMRFIRDTTSHTSYITSLGRLQHNCVDDSKLTDHHAILVTGSKIKDLLSRNEIMIYNMIVDRIVESFSKDCIKEFTTVKVLCDGVPLTIKGTTITDMGWRAVLKDSFESLEIPQWSVGDELAVRAISITEGKTRPKPLHTESSLLAAMQSAGREIEDSELRKSIEECGIGTPATRAAIIEALLKRDYLVRQKRILMPTEKGLALYSIVKNMEICDPLMTAKWETALSAIEKGEMSASDFRKGIEEYTHNVTMDLLTCDKIFGNIESEHQCPKCKSGKMRIYNTVLSCDNDDCNLRIYRVKGGVKLDNIQIATLLSGGTTEVIKNFKNHNGKSFQAALKLNTEFIIDYVCS